MSIRPFVFLACIFISFLATAQTTEQKVKALLAKMTIEEKMGQLKSIYVGKSGRGDNATLNQTQLDTMFKYGVGQMCQPGKRRPAAEISAFTNRIQEHLLTKTRLKIPAFMHEEGLHGMIANGVTSFSTPIAMAATWDTSLIHAAFDRIGREMRISGLHIALSPVLDVAREPRWGRFEETFGEDPYLVSAMGVAAVKGFQNTDAKNSIPDRKHVMATGKHFVGYSATENGLNVAPSVVGKRELFEVYLKPFRAAIKEASLMGIMPSYSEWDGIPVHANSYLLKDVLRKDLGFKGIVNSDYGGVDEILNLHKMSKTKKESALYAFKAGVDFDAPNLTSFRFIPELIKEGTISMAELDEKVSNILRLKYEMGLFDQPYSDSTEASAYVGNQEGALLSKKVAEQSVVLLKNSDKLLPITSGAYARIAVVGPNAANSIQGAYFGSSKYTVSVLEGIKTRMAGIAEVTYAEGCRITYDKKFKVPVVKAKPEDPDKFDEFSKTLVGTVESEQALLKEAVAVMQEADLIVVCVGGNMATTRESFKENPMGDRADLSLSPAQQELLKLVKKTGKPFVVNLIHGGPITDDFLFDSCQTVVEAMYQGQESGNVLASILFGDINPSGKLPFTIPRSAGHLPSFYNYKPSARRGYGFTDNSPRYPFGFGLSYTSFTLSDAQISKSVIGKNESVSVKVKVSNTGSRSGRQIVQLYIRDEISSVPRPIKELKGFQSVVLPAGASEWLTFTIRPTDLAFYNKDFKEVVEAGDFTITLATHAADADGLVLKLEVK